MSDPTSSISSGFVKPTGYHDFGGLASLRGEAAQGSDNALRETAKQFETYFIQQTMKTMRESVEKSELTENADADTFQDMMDKEVATKMAERGSLGLADMMVKSLSQRQVSTPSTQEVLAARAAFPLQAPAQAAPLHGASPASLPVPRSGGAMTLESGLYGRQPQAGQGAPAAAKAEGGEQ